ncbi:Uncharacterized protein PBTT_06147 [Plasmodiophora brassicae]
MESMAALSPDDRAMVVSLVQLFAGAVDGLANVVAERDSMSKALVRKLPPVTIQELLKVRGSAFGAAMTQLKPRLLRNGKTEADIQQIETEFGELRAAYRQEPRTKAAIDDLHTLTSFEEPWKILDRRFYVLQASSA